jgi:hypothetical protein
MAQPPALERAGRTLGELAGHTHETPAGGLELFAEAAVELAEVALAEGAPVATEEHQHGEGAIGGEDGVGIDEGHGIAPWRRAIVPVGWFPCMDA